MCPIPLYIVQSVILKHFNETLAVWVFDTFNILFYIFLLFNFIVFYLESDILSSFLFCSFSLLCWDDNKMSYTLSHIVSYSSWNTRDNNTINVKCLASK